MARWAKAPVLTNDEQVRKPIRVAVLPLKDKREERDKIAKLHQFPLILWSSGVKSKFDVAFGSKTPRWTKEISRRLTEELAQRNAFATVEYVESMEDARKFPLVIRGDLNLSEQRNTAYGYGVSFLARYLWYLGFPKFSRYWDVEAKFTVFETVDDKAIWDSDPISLQTSREVFWVYSDEYNIDAIMNDAFDNLVKVAASDIQKGLPSIQKDAKLYASLTEKHARKKALREAQGSALSNILPPELLINNPKSGARVRSDSIGVDWRASSVSRLKSVKLFVNNKQIFLDQLDGQLKGKGPKDAPRAFSETTDIDLRMGMNRIRLDLVDQLDQTLHREIEVTRLPKRLYQEQRYAVVIGLDDYQDPSIPGGLSGAKWAEELKNYLTDEFGGQMPKQDVFVLTGAKATREAIVLALDSIVKNAVNSDSIFIYFNGYSLAAQKSGPGYLLTYDTDLTKLEETALSIELLRQLLEQSLASNTIVITDAAYPLESYELNAQELLANLTRRLRNVAVISSTQRGDEFTKDTASGETFSKVMIEDVLKGDIADLNKDGSVTLRELVDSLVEECELRGVGSPGENGRYDRNLGIKMLE